MTEWKSKATTTLEVLLLAIVAAFVAAISIGVFLDLFWGVDSKPTEAFRGAFLGAFFAFIFVRIGEGLTRFYDAARDSRRALVSIQLSLNEALSIADDNRFVFEQWKRFYREMRAERGSIRVFTNRLDPIPSFRAAFINIGSIGLLNELFQLESTARKLNDSMETWQRSYELARDRFIASEIDQASTEMYVANVEYANGSATELLKFVDSLMDEVMSALAATRLLLRQKPFLAKLYSWLNPDKYPKPNDPYRAAELDKLKLEVLEISAASRKRIEEITTGSASPR